ncbi:hypothetical protein ACEPAF_3841 [Sanghuangporus sanghuang]
MTLFRRSSAVSCYYCLSLIDPYSASSSRAGPFNRSSFRCPYCGCLNQYDSHGQIVGDEAAMRDERLNIDSFSKRGLPDRNHLPSLAGQRSSSVFCRACQTNQTLLINLRAAYLPAPEDPSYATRIAQLPAYIASLQSRYPPVCPSCQPAVDAEIARKDEFARTRALANALKTTSRPPPRAGNVMTPMKSSQRSLRTWRIRGVLWTMSYFIAISANAAGLFDFAIPPFLRRLAPVLPLLVLFSVVWAFWDPSYSLQQKSCGQGGKVHIGGRQRYIFLQSLAWIYRLLSSILLVCSWIKRDWDFLHLHAPINPSQTSRKQIYFGTALIFEFSILVLSYFAITIHRPVPIRLIDTSAHRALSQPSKTNPSSHSDAQSALHANRVQPEPDLFSTLSLSGNPVITSTSVNPMFGQPSLAPGQATGNNDNDREIRFEDDEDEEDGLPRRMRPRDPDAMDWEPATPAKQALAAQKNSRCRSTDDGTWLRQQRFFPPEEPTGLEGLFMRARLMDEDDAAARRARGSATPKRKIKWAWVYSASVVPVIAVLVALWFRSRS